MITALDQLEACMGVAPQAVELKVIDHLDGEAARWIGAAPLLFIATSRPEGVAATVAGGRPGFAFVLDPSRLALPVDGLDGPELLQVGQGVGLLVLVPGLGETLRVNGRVAAVTDVRVEVAVEEVYVHCAKALMRSAFWTAPARSDAPADAAGFLHAARFVALATADAAGRADLSPKGDPAGCMLRLSGAEVGYAERPGNRRKDSLKNILTQPQVAALALIPGATALAVVTGRARMQTDEAARAAFAVDGKLPKLVTVLGQATVALRDSAALRRANLWPVRSSDHGIDPAAVLAAHIKLNKTAGASAALLRKAMSQTLIRAGLAQDYKKNMY